MGGTTVRIERFETSQGYRIHLKSGWFPGVAEMCKSVPGASWNKTQQVWTYPCDLPTCRNLRRVFTDMLQIGPNLSAWAREAIAEEEALRALGRLRDAELTLVPSLAPKMAEAMARRTYQRVAARFIARARRVCIADEPAMGKTLEILAGIMEADLWFGQHIIVAPKTSTDVVWATEIRKWTDARPFPMPEGKAARARTIDQFISCQDPIKFLIVNPEMLQIKLGNWCKICEEWQDKTIVMPDEHYTDAHPWDIRIMKQDWPILHDAIWNSVIVDEAHKCLLGIRGSGPFKKTQTGEGLTSLKVVRDGVMVAATGSPLKGKPRNFWPTFHWLRPKEYSSFWRWAETYLVVQDNGYGLDVKGINPLREEDLYKSLDSIMLRRTRRECQAELPPKDYQDHWVDMLPAQKRQYTSMLEEGEALIGDQHVQAMGILAEFTRLKQLSFGEWKVDSARNNKMTPVASPKFEWLAWQLEKRGVTGDPETEFGEMKYVIGSQFTEILDWCERQLNALGIETIKITGGVSNKRRAEAQRNFESPGGARVLLINVQAGGVAITLDRYCDEMFILDETWVRDEMVQLEGRIDNRKAEERVAPRVYHYIRTRETVEQSIAESGLTQDEIQAALLDTRRGVAFAKRLLKGQSVA